MLLMMALTGLALPTSDADAATTLGVEGSQFTLNEKPTFLHGISYYGALGASEESIRADLDDMQRVGLNWMRLWATWNAFGCDVSAVDGEGNAREPYLTKLKQLVAECDRRGMVVDVTLTRGTATIQALETHRRAVETLVTALKEFRNWYLDLGNERNIRDARYVSYEDLKSLRDLAKQLDPTRLITASHAGGDLSREDLRRYVLEVGVDFVSPHRPRDAGSPQQTEAKTRELLRELQELGRVVPVHYQEPFRRDYGEWQPKAEDFVTDWRGAISGGAAGWCLHNGSARGKEGERPRRSFDLRDRRLFEQLDEEELKALTALAPRP